MLAPVVKSRVALGRNSAETLDLLTPFAGGSGNSRWWSREVDGAVRVGSPMSPVCSCARRKTIRAAGYGPREPATTFVDRMPVVVPL